MTLRSGAVRLAGRRPDKGERWPIRRSPERRSRRFYRLTEAGEVERDRLRVEIEPYLDAVARSIDLIRGEVLEG